MSLGLAPASALEAVLTQSPTEYQVVIGGLGGGWFDSVTGRIPAGQGLFSVGAQFCGPRASLLDRRGLRRVFVLEYIGSMKVKTSVTLSEDILKTIDRLARKGESRSEAIERLLRESLAEQARRAADLKELALINQHAERLNAETEDVLSYQADL